MTPVQATKEEKLLAFGNRIIGITNDLTEAGIACKLSVAFGKFTFNLDTTRLAKSPSRRGKKRLSKLRHDKRRRIEFLKKKQPNLPQKAPPTDCLSETATEGGVILEGRGEGGSGETRDAGAEIEKTDDEANEAQGEVSLQSINETI